MQAYQNIGFLSRISKITFVSDYNLLKATYWPANGLWEVIISKFLFCFMDVKIQVFLSRIFKNRSLGGHILASKWPWLLEVKIRKSIFASWVLKYFSLSEILKIALTLDFNLQEATFWPPNELWLVKKFLFLLQWVKIQIF